MYTRCNPVSLRYGNFLLCMYILHRVFNILFEIPNKFRPPFRKSSNGESNLAYKIHDQTTAKYLCFLIKFNKPSIIKIFR